MRDLSHASACVRSARKILLPSTATQYLVDMMFRQLLDKATREIYDHSVSLILDQKLIGSGTLVDVSGLAGILTAGHVSDLIRKRPHDEIGIAVANHRHEFFVPVSHLENFVIGHRAVNRGEERGPDLSFLRILDLNKLATLRSKKSFFRVDSKTFSRLREIPPDKVGWFIAGAPAEFSPYVGTKGAPERILDIGLLVGGATFRSVYDHEGFDYVRLSVNAGEHDFPSHFGGVSGGGIWLVPFTICPEKGPVSLDYKAVFLAGVAFFQSDLKEKEREIIGHGPSSIYTRLPQSLKDAGT